MVVHLFTNTDYECAVEEHRPHLDQQPRRLLQANLTLPIGSATNSVWVHYVGLGNTYDFNRPRIRSLFTTSDAFPL